MAAARKIDPFVLVVADHDKKVFTVEGPMVDDNPWNTAVVRAQEQGREINCFVPGEEARFSVPAAIAAYEQEFGYKHVAPGSIVRRSR